MVSPRSEALVIGSCGGKGTFEGFMDEVGTHNELASSQKMSSNIFSYQLAVV